MALVRRKSNINEIITHTPNTTVAQVIAADNAWRAAQTPINQPVINNSFTASIAPVGVGRTKSVVTAATLPLVNQSFFTGGTLTNTAFQTLRNIFENSDEFSRPSTGPGDTIPLSSANLAKSLASAGWGYIDARPLIGGGDRISRTQITQMSDKYGGKPFIIDYSLKGGLGMSSTYYSRR